MDYTRDSQPISHTDPAPGVQERGPRSTWQIFNTGIRFQIQRCVRLRDTLISNTLKLERTALAAHR